MAILKRWNGSEWLDVTSIKYYDDAWLDVAVMKYYDSGWIDINFISLWNGIYYESIVTPPATIDLGIYPTSKTLYIDVSELEPGREVNITVDVAGNRGRTTQLTELVSEIPATGTINTGIKGLDVGGKSVYRIAKSFSTINTFCLYFAFELPLSLVTGIEILPERVPLWDGTVYMGTYASAGNVVINDASFPNYESILINVSHLTAGEVIRITQSSNNGRYKICGIADAIGSLPLDDGEPSGAIAGIGYLELSEDASAPYEYEYTIVAGTNTICWSYSTTPTAGIVTSVEVL
jgi:hypothetical protein